MHFVAVWLWFCTLAVTDAWVSVNSPKGQQQGFGEVEVPDVLDAPELLAPNAPAMISINDCKDIRGAWVQKALFLDKVMLQKTADRLELLEDYLMQDPIPNIMAQSDDQLGSTFRTFASFVDSTLNYVVEGHNSLPKQPVLERVRRFKNAAIALHKNIPTYPEPYGAVWEGEHPLELENPVAPPQFLGRHTNLTAIHCTTSFFHLIGTGPDPEEDPNQQKDANEAAKEFMAGLLNDKRPWLWDKRKQRNDRANNMMKDKSQYYYYTDYQGIQDMNPQRRLYPFKGGLPFAQRADPTSGPEFMFYNDMWSGVSSMVFLNPRKLKGWIRGMNMDDVTSLEELNYLENHNFGQYHLRELMDRLDFVLLRALSKLKTMFIGNFARVQLGPRPTPLNGTNPCDHIGLPLEGDQNTGTEHKPYDWACVVDMARKNPEEAVDSSFAFMMFVGAMYLDQNDWSTGMNENITEARLGFPTWNRRVHVANSLGGHRVGVKDFADLDYLHNNNPRPGAALPTSDDETGRKRKRPTEDDGELETGGRYNGAKKGDNTDDTSGKRKRPMEDDGELESEGRYHRAEKGNDVEDGSRKRKRPVGDDGEQDNDGRYGRARVVSGMGGTSPLDGSSRKRKRPIEDDGEAQTEARYQNRFRGAKKVGGTGQQPSKKR